MPAAGSRDHASSSIPLATVPGSPQNTDNGARLRRHRGFFEEAYLNHLCRAVDLDAERTAQALMQALDPVLEQIAER